MRFTKLFVLTLCIASSLTACSGLRFPGVYRLQIEQGNIITQEMVDTLEPGMTKRQVNFVLGTPMIMDPFSEDRWDYLFTLRARNNQTLRRNLTVYFADDKLTHFTGDYKPTPKDDIEDESENTDAANSVDSEGSVSEDQPAASDPVEATPGPT